MATAVRTKVKTKTNTYTTNERAGIDKLREITRSIHGGRIVKYKGNAASYAPSFGLALAPTFALAPAFKRAALALLSSATIAILASVLAPSAALAQSIY